ncbi:hypothetical protein JSQ81_06270 [Sporosarcina sp. Marseille-Q4063]|uniref:hypothetical protein n=1 Tax=Sporosarcina sp. Marseille-Q4063 TaxID=2810514 RepID=UPI001BB06EEF|nr:hypothetical protein [Sporosarcina sp. Marseille-Q4063]QUW23165.1 hypothetical protein JSQ81_06270 [Sporosarcina sp. Marseille-Q4063]
MYDPTIFENLKVAFENHIYDLDNIDEKITIINRVDRMDYAILSREYAIQFTLVNQTDLSAEIVLQASVKELAGEILEVPGENLGSTLSVRFTKIVQSVIECQRIEQVIKAIWETDIHLTQTLSFVYAHHASGYLNSIDMTFKSKINEKHMADIADLLDHVLESLEVLEAL